MRVGVVGLGLIGGSVLRSLGDAVGYDAVAAVREAAAGEGFEVARSLGGLAGCELVIVAVPPARTAEVVRAVLEGAPDAMVADTASVKAPVLAALGVGGDHRGGAGAAGRGAGEAAIADRFVGAHPLAGAETAGWGASAAETLAGAVWAVCPAGESVGPACRLSAAVDRLGGRLVACTAEEHDAAVARTSHVPHLLAAALAGLAGHPLQAALSGTALRDMTRVARADAALWADILAANRTAAMAALDDLEAALAGLRVALAGGDPAVLERVWERAAEALTAVDAARWREPAWSDGGIEGGWDGLLALGRAGRSVRRLRLDGAGLRAEISLERRVRQPEPDDLDARRGRRR